MTNDIVKALRSEARAVVETKEFEALEVDWKGVTNMKMVKISLQDQIDVLYSLLSSMHFLRDHENEWVNP